MILDLDFENQTFTFGKNKNVFQMEEKIEEIADLTYDIEDAFEKAWGNIRMGIFLEDWEGVKEGSEKLKKVWDALGKLEELCDEKKTEQN